MGADNTQGCHGYTILIYVQLWRVCVCVRVCMRACLCVQAPDGGREGTWFPPATPAGEPVLNKVNWLIGSEQVKAQPVMIILCVCSFIFF